MAFPIGGRSDKLGNSYENRFLVKKYLDLLNNKVQSIIVEPIGDDEEGVEFWIRHFNGTREAYQCKARNAMNKAWSVSSLKYKGVLDRLKTQLDRSEKHRFIFVSAVSSNSLKDLCIDARNSPDDVELFYEHLLKGKAKKDLFQEFCRALSLDYKNPNEGAQAFKYLKRSYFETYPDEHPDLYNMVGICLSGDPETVVSVLADYAIENDRLGIEIYADELYKYLKDRNIHLRNLAYDSKIVPVLESLKNQFRESIAPVLIRGSLLAREETQECIEKLEESGLLIIFGDAGNGKSGVLYELIQIYQQKNNQYLPLRVDRQIPKQTPKFYGQSLGLPDSPIVTLHAIAGDRPALIIIDQLDAIRWTSLHSADSFEICKEMVNQVLLLRRQNQDIRVILSCRSFDMKHDRRLNNWISNIKNDNQHKWLSVEIKKLPENSVKDVVGTEFDRFNVQQKQLLSNIQNLFMWCELKDKGLITNFTSSIDLLSEFMLYKKQSIENEGVSNAEIESTLKVLTEHMESRSENSFPGYLVSSLSPRVVASFSSSGILTEADRKLSFGHQIYLDFLIAQRVIFEITDDYSVVDWLESRDKQTLFRREQLRHVLIMLSQDNIGKFISISDLLIKSTEVRFHFKHLVLEVFSSIVDFDQRIYSFLNNLLHNKSWNPHIIHSVVIGNPMYIKELVRNGYIKKMLNSSNDDHIDEAIQILRSVKHSIQHEIVCLMKSFIDKGANWYPRILNVIGWDVENDITSMFEFRIELMQRGYYPIFIHWEKFISTDSLRALIVTEVILNEIEQPPQTRAQKIEKHDLKFISKAVKQHPGEAWDKYIPLILKSVKNLEDYEIERLNKSIHELSPLAVAVELTIIASCKIASSQPLTWIEKVNALSHIDSAVIEYIIARGMAHLPNDYADFGIQWLLNNPKRLTAGNSLGEPDYLWSRLIIEKLTPFCNDGNFANLEKLLIYYHEQNELKKARRMLLLRRKSEGGIYYPYWGVPQYLLISKLSPDRMSAYSKELLSILKRKFSDTTDKELMDNNIIHVGVSVSAIGENIDRISDRAWIQIISNNKIPCKGNYTKKYNKEEKIWTESSVWQFSRSLENAAIMNPARFVKLAISFPDNVHPQYVSAIFAALQSTRDTYTNQKNADNIYKSASIEDVVSFIEKYQKFEDNSVAISFCRLILERNEEDWPQLVLSKLVDLAMFHMDPLPENLNVHHSNWDGKLQNAKIEDIFTSGLNCVRGTAAQAIANILWKKGELLKFFSNAIESLVTDQHIVVRMAALSILLPVLNINRDLSIQWFRKAVDCDLRIVMSRYGLRIINHTIKSHYSTIAPIIQLMIDANNADIVIQGSEFITGFWVKYGFFEEELHKCLSGTIDQKKGIVKFATEHLVNFETMEKCKDLLSQLIESDAEELSKELSDLFRYDIMKYPENVELINQYLRSDAFSDSLMIVHSLKEYEGNLLGFSEVVFSLFDAFKRHKNKGENSSYRFRHDVEGAIELLIRLYEQSKNIDSFVFIKCLDTWDMLLEERISEAMVLQQQLNK